MGINQADAVSGGEQDQSRDNPATSEDASNEAKLLRQEILDLRILNGGKDYFIKQLRDGREGLIGQLVDASRKVGELETTLRQLSERRSDSR